MPAYKDKAKGTWYASFYYEDWTGKKVKKMKRGFPTKREALEWERTFLQQQTADLEMTFENFVAVYVADMKGRIKENTWGTKEHTISPSCKATVLAELSPVFAAYAAGVCAKLNRAFRTDLTNTPGGYIL